MGIRNLKPLLMVVAAVALVMALEQFALACPTCKDTLAGNDPTRQGLVQGYFYSILFMMSMPFTILAGLSLYFYYEVRKARRRQATTSAAARERTLVSA